MSWPDLCGSGESSPTGFHGMQCTFESHESYESYDWYARSFVHLSVAIVQYTLINSTAFHFCEGLGDRHLKGDLWL